MGACHPRDFLSGKPFNTWKTRRETRGMSPWWDVIDWIGGYPFEVAKPGEVIDFYGKKGFEIEKLVTCGKGHGNNEFVLKKTS